jgi:autotransporter-associated beta strand protein
VNASKTYGDTFDVSNSYTIAATGIAAAPGAYLGVIQASNVTLNEVFDVNPVFSSDRSGAGALVGSSLITINPGDLKNQFFNIEYKPEGLLTVNQRPITLEANTASKVYNPSIQDPGLSVRIVSGSVAANANDTLADITGIIEREAGENAGQYDILLGTGAKASNYAITFEANNNAFTIHRANLSATGSRQYDGTTTWLGTNLQVSGVNGETFSATSINAGLLATKHVQTAQSLVSLDGLELAGVVSNGYTPLLSNYNPLTVAQTSVTVTPRILNLIAPNVSKVYDANLFYEVKPGDLDDLTLQLSSGDRVTSAQMAFTNKDAGENKTVQLNAFTIDDGNSGNNYQVTRVSSTQGVITPAPLVIRAVDDADFVTWHDSRINVAEPWNSYAGVIYTGLVGGETPAVLTRGSVTRSNSNVTAASDQPYAGVLIPSGFSSTNYNITELPGSYTIVRAGTLLVRAAPASVAYGSAPTYSLTAEYLESVNNQQVIRTFSIPNASGRITFDDGSGGEANFSIAAVNPVRSSAQILAAGGYNLNYSDLQLVGSSNFNRMVLVGSLTVTPKVLSSNLGINRIEKVYDGTNSIANLNLNFNQGNAGVFAGDEINLFGVGTFNDRHVGVNKAVNISLALRGDDAANYTLASNNFTNPVGAITQLNSVQWVGADGASWSVATNWAGGALPDGNNVANIVIPTSAVTVLDSNAFGTSTSAINNQGVIRFISPNNYTFANAVAGPGTLEQRGTGVLTVSGNNTMSGVVNIGSSSVLLGHNNALGQGYVVSNGGAIGLNAGIVLPSLRIDGAVTTTTAITSTGNQIYNGALTFTALASPTPVLETDPVRAANFESSQGSVMFMNTVNGAGNRLVVSATNGGVRFNGEVGESFVGNQLSNFERVRWSDYATKVNNNPSGVDVLANEIFINANIATKGPQLYTGQSKIGSPTPNSPNTVRMLLSLNPSITFVGPVDNGENGLHTLVLRAISLTTQDDPSITLGPIGQTAPLARLDVLAGRQEERGSASAPLVAEITTDRTQYAGNVTIGGSVATLGDQLYVSNTVDIASSSASPVVLSTRTGSIEVITGLNPSNPTQVNPITGLANTRIERGPRARGAGSELRANASSQGQSLAERIVGRLPSEGDEQTGSGMVIAFKRALDRIQTRQPDLDDYLDISGNALAGGEVSIGALQDVTNTPATGAEPTSSGATQIDCSDQVVAQANQEQCRSTNRD